MEDARPDRLAALAMVQFHAEAWQTVVATIYSKRQQTKHTLELINTLAAKFGNRIVWRQHYDRTQARSNLYEGDSYIDTYGATIFFREHGNKFSNYLQVYSSDPQLMERVKAVLPDLFPRPVEIREHEFL